MQFIDGIVNIRGNREKGTCTAWVICGMLGADNDMLGNQTERRPSFCHQREWTECPAGAIFSVFIFIPPVGGFFLPA